VVADRKYTLSSDCLLVRRGSHNPKCKRLSLVSRIDSLQPDGRPLIPLHAHWKEGRTGNNLEELFSQLTTPSRGGNTAACSREETGKAR